MLSFSKKLIIKKEIQIKKIKTSTTAAPITNPNGSKYIKEANIFIKYFLFNDKNIINLNYV
jgi:hypothetical protein